MWMSGGHRSGSSSVANPHEADSGSGLRVVAPDGNLAAGAARDLLASSACRWRIDHLRLARGMHDSIRLVEGVERVGCTGLALAPATVAGVDNERRAGQSIPDLAASASALHGVLRPMLARTPDLAIPSGPWKTDPGSSPLRSRKRAITRGLRRLNSTIVSMSSFDGPFGPGRR